MLFNSYIFLLVFLPVALLCFTASPPKARLWLLLCASLIFYGYSGVEPLIAMLFSIFWVHYVIRISAILPTNVARILIFAVPLLLLFLFRYLDFALNTVDAEEHTRASFSFFLDIAVPAGISFYTFQIISYGIDVLDGKVPAETKVYRLITYVSLFPQLVAGPIVRYASMQPQLTEIESGAAKRDVDGYRLITIGLIYKVIFADGLNLLHQQASNIEAGVGLIDHWLSLFIYSLQIYYDFFGYSLIALGLGKLLGLKLPINFDRPYLSINPKVFWRCWHITLSIWLRDYVYLRLGGSRYYVRNIIIIFLLVGLWHGADWSFVAWGGYHALLVLMYHANRQRWDRLPAVVQIAVTFVLISFGWPLFYLDLEGYLAFIGDLFTYRPTLLVVYQLHEIVFFSVILLWTFIPPMSKNTFKRCIWSIFNRPMLQALLIAFVLLFFPVSTPFIYFRF